MNHIAFHSSTERHRDTGRWRTPDPRHIAPLHGANPDKGKRVGYILQYS